MASQFPRCGFRIARIDEELQHRALGKSTVCETCLCSVLRVPVAVQVDGKRNQSFLLRCWNIQCACVLPVHQHFFVI